MKRQAILKAIFAMALCLGLTLTQSQLFFIKQHWVDEEAKFVTILIDETLTYGSDGACKRAGLLFHAITSQGYTLYVRSPNDFVPSAKNPMDVEWTKILVDDASY